MVTALRQAGPGFWLRASVWAVIAALATGVPTVLIANSFFRRMTPTSEWQYVAWVAAALLAGMVLATRRLPGADCRVEGRTLAGGGLAFLAVGCPICNKVVVALLGVSGALSYFAPMQPLLAVASIGVLIFTLHRILRSGTLAKSRMVSDKSGKLSSRADAMVAWSAQLPTSRQPEGTFASRERGFSSQAMSEREG